MMQTATSSGAPLKGWHVLLMLLGFFGAVIAVNVVFVVYAISSFPGEEEQHAYSQGVRFNETLKEQARQEQLGWRATLIPAPAGVLRLRVEGRAGPIDMLTVKGAFRRPTHDGDDFSAIFRSLGSGLYEADLGGARPGVWEMRAVATGATGEVMKLQQRLVLQ